MFVCRKTFEQGGIQRTTWKLIKDFWASEPQCQNDLCIGDEYLRNHHLHSQSEVSHKSLSLGKSMLMKGDSFFGIDEMQGALKMNQIEKSERRSYSRKFFLLVIMVLTINIAIIQHGFKLDLNLSPLTVKQHLLCNLIAFFILPWHWVTKRIVKVCYDVEDVQEWHTVGGKNSKYADVKLDIDSNKRKDI